MLEQSYMLALLGLLALALLIVAIDVVRRAVRRMRGGGRGAGTGSRATHIDLMERIGAQSEPDRSAGLAGAAPGEAQEEAREEGPLAPVARSLTPQVAAATPAPAPTAPPARDVPVAPAPAPGPGPASIELRFTGSDAPVEIEPDTRLFSEFRRLANVLLADLRSGRDG